MSEPVKDLTSSSVESIYTVNKLRDGLATPINSAQLNNLGVESIVFYGSSMKGKARPNSDIDIYVIHRGLDDYGPRFSELSIHDQYQKTLEYKTNIANILKRSGAEAVGIDGVDYKQLYDERNGNMHGVVHLAVVGKDERYGYDSGNKKPTWINEQKDDGIQIWNSIPNSK